MNNNLKIELHHDMKSRANELLRLLDTVEPGEIPENPLVTLACRDVENTARYLRQSFESEKLSCDMSQIK